MPVAGRPGARQAGSRDDPHHRGASSSAADAQHTPNRSARSAVKPATGNVAAWTTNPIGQCCDAQDVAPRPLQPAPLIHQPNNAAADTGTGRGGGRNHCPQCPRPGRQPAARADGKRNSPRLIETARTATTDSLGAGRLFDLL